MQLWLVYMGLMRTLRMIRPDVIHIYCEPWGGRVLQILFGPGAGRVEAPVCIHAAETLYDQGPRLERTARSAILAKVFPRIAGFVSWSELGIEEARRAGLKDVPTEIVPGIVPDPEVLAPIRGADREQLRSELGLPPGMPVVGYVGRLAEEKGIRDLLAALERLEETRRSPYLAIWGAGPLEGLVKNWITSDPRRGAYGGPLAIGDVPRAFRACDAMVLPSRRTSTKQEQFGRVLLEAMLVDCPIIAYRSGAIPEAVGQGALLVDEGDVSGLSAAIHELMSDQGARDALAARAREQAHRFHPRVLGEKMNLFWSEVIRRSSGRSA